MYYLIKKIAAACLAISVAITMSMVAMPVASASTDHKVIALTFDDGPNTSTCKDVLKKLAKYNVPATFFIIGQNVKSGTEDVMKQMVSQGCQIGSHSYNHNYMTNMTIDQLNEDFQKTSDAIYSQAGVRPTIMRWPYLSVPNAAKNNDLFPYAAMGGECPNDWDGGVSEQQTIDGVLNKACDGGIILLHCFEGNSKTVSALDTIIPTLQSQGYTFLTIDDMFKAQNNAQTLGVQWNKVPYSATQITTPSRTSTVSSPTSSSTSGSTSPTSFNPNDNVVYGSYTDWYTNSAVSTINNNGVDVAMNVSNYVKQVQPSFNIQNFSTLINTAKGSDGYIYVDVAGTFETGDTAKLMLMAKMGDIWINQEASWGNYTLNSGGKLTIKFPVASMNVNSSVVQYTLQNYTYGSGLLNGNFTISNPYAYKVAQGSTSSTTTKTTTTTTTTTTSSSSSNVILYGDVNNDGKVNGKDSLTLKMYNAGQTPAVFNAEAADVNLDGKINGKDSLVLKKFNAGNINSLPCTDAN